MKNQLIHISVLQNGSEICQIKHPLHKKRSFTLTGKSKGAFSIPLYRDLNLHVGHTNQQGFHLDTSSFEDGLLYLRGSSLPYTKNAAPLQLRKGDRATLRYSDLTLLIQVINVTTASKPVKNPLYIGHLRQLLLFPSDPLYLTLALAFSGSLLAAMFLFLPANQPKKELSLKNLHPEFLLGILAPENLSTAPEALMDKLDRGDYLASVLGYYEDVHNALKYKFNLVSDSIPPSTIKRLKASQTKDEIQNTNTLHRLTATLEKNKQNQTPTAVLPIVIGRSHQGLLTEYVNTIKRLHSSHKFNLEKRFQISNDFRLDPEYDWTEYINVDTAQKKQLPTKLLSKIKVFDQLTNEQYMYYKANLLAKRAELLQPPLGEKITAKLPSEIYFDSTSKLAVQVAAHLDPNSSFEQVKGSILGKEKDASEPITGSLALSKIKNTVRRHQQDLYYCYEIALRQNPTFAGELQINWLIDSTGKASKISIGKHAFKHSPMIECLKRKIAMWNFPKPQGGSIKISHLFLFKPETKNK